MKKILVTGGLGFLGSALTKKLVAEGHIVRVLDNSSRGSKEKLGDAVNEVEIIEGDIRDPSIVGKAVKGMDAVWHLAFVNGTEFFYQQPAYVLDVGVKGMVNVLDACIASGAKELVLASSSEVYQTPPKVPTDESVELSVPDPLNARYSYGGGKIISELMAINYGREHFERVLIFRPHNVYGPAMGFEHVIPQFVLRMKELSSGAEVPFGSAQDRREPPLRFPIQGDGKQTRSFIYVDDFIDGLMVMHAKGEHLNIYHVGTMDEVTIAELAQKVAKAMDLSITLATGPEAPGGTPRRCPDIGKLRALGFRPSWSLEKGLVPTVAWYREHEKPASGTMRSPSLFL